jgi:hypothetical protein
VTAGTIISATRFGVDAAQGLTRHGLGMPARSPKRSASASSPLPAAAPARRPRRRSIRCLRPAPYPAWSARGAGVRLRRAEEIETLSHRTVVELNAESRLAPEQRVATIARRLNASNGWPASGPAAPIAASSSASRLPSVPTDPSSPGRGRWLPMPADQAGDNTAIVTPRRGGACCTWPQASTTGGSCRRWRWPPADGAAEGRDPARQATLVIAADWREPCRRGKRQGG